MLVNSTFFLIKKSKGKFSMEQTNFEMLFLAQPVWQRKAGWIKQGAWKQVFKPKSLGVKLSPCSNSGCTSTKVAPAVGWGSPIHRGFILARPHARGGSRGLRNYIHCLQEEKLPVRAQACWTGWFISRKDSFAIRLVLQLSFHPNYVFPKSKKSMLLF